MRLFAVRVIADKQPVGFFWAPDFSTFWWMIDSVCDPGGCEYRRISDRAAITWQDRVNAKLGAGVKFDEETGESEELKEIREKLCFDFALEDFVLGEVEGEWLKVPYANEPGSGVHELIEQQTKQNRPTKKRPKKKRSKKTTKGTTRRKRAKKKNVRLIPPRN